MGRIYRQPKANMGKMRKKEEKTRQKLRGRFKPVSSSGVGTLFALFLFCFDVSLAKKFFIASIFSVPSFFVVDLDGVVVVGTAASFSPSSSLMTMGIKCSVSVPSGGSPGGPLPRGLERLPAGEIHKR